MKSNIANVMYYISTIWVVAVIIFIMRTEYKYILGYGRYSALIPVEYFLYTFIALLIFLISTAMDPKRVKIIAFLLLYLSPVVIFVLCKPYFNGDFLK